MRNSCMESHRGSDGRLFTVDQAARELAVSKFTVRSWVAQRRIGHIKLGRSVRIPRAEIERLLELGTVPPARVA